MSERHTRARERQAEITGNGVILCDVCDTPLSNHRLGTHDVGTVGYLRLWLLLQNLTEAQVGLDTFEAFTVMGEVVSMSRSQVTRQLQTREVDNRAKETLLQTSRLSPEGLNLWAQYTAESVAQHARQE